MMAAVLMEGRSAHATSKPDDPFLDALEGFASGLFDGAALLVRQLRDDPPDCPREAEAHRWGLVYLAEAVRRDVNALLSATDTVRPLAERVAILSQRSRVA
jgi:hypothetical protein